MRVLLQNWQGHEGHFFGSDICGEVVVASILETLLILSAGMVFVVHLKIGCAGPVGRVLRQHRTCTH